MWLDNGKATRPVARQITQASGIGGLVRKADHASVNTKQYACDIAHRGDVQGFACSGNKCDGHRNRYSNHAGLVHGKKLLVCVYVDKMPGVPAASLDISCFVLAASGLS